LVSTFIGVARAAGASVVTQLERIVHRLGPYVSASTSASVEDDSSASSATAGAAEVNEQQPT
jgi:hypothetical protein